MCEGRLHTLFGKQKKLKSLLGIRGSELVSGWAHKHQKQLSFSCSSTATPACPGRRSQQHRVGCHQHLKDQVPAHEHHLFHGSGEGTWGRDLHPTPPYCGTDSDEGQGSHTFLTIILPIAVFYSATLSSALVLWAIRLAPNQPPGSALGSSQFLHVFPDWSDNQEGCTRRGHEPGSPLLGHRDLGREQINIKLRYFQGQWL